MKILQNKNFLFWVITSIILILGLYQFFLMQKNLIKESRSHIQKDFPAFFIAAKLANKKQNIYSLEKIKESADENQIPYTEYRANLYPPPFSLLISIFSGLNLYKAQEYFVILKIFILIVLSLLVPAMILNSSFYKSTFSVNERYLYTLLIFGLSLNFFALNNGIVSDMRDGQMNILTGFLVFLSFAFEVRFPVVSGFFIALGGSIKLSPYYLTMKFLFGKNKNSIFGTIVFSIFLFLASLYYFGFEIHKIFIQNIFIPFFKEDSIPILNWPLSHSQNQSFKGLFYRLFIPDYPDPLSGTQIIYYAPWIAKLLTLIFNFMVIGICSVIAYRSVKLNNIWSSGLTYSVFVSGALLTSPLTWFHHFSFLVFPFSVTIAYLVLEKRKEFKYMLFFIFIGILFALPPLFLYPETRIKGFSFLNYIKLFANCVFFLFIVKLYLGIEKQERTGNENN
ncbi:MAG: DUF2029 domain-containing protein [Leptospiraceae bacterium]|nr:DUF2029 domain-containing protein [Leptospiraceae bacterium]